MLVHTVCPTCSRESTVPDLYIGKSVKCVGCGERFQVRAVQADPFPLTPISEAKEATPEPAIENPYIESRLQVNWQGYPFFYCACPRTGSDVPLYRCYFTRNRLVFLPYLVRPWQSGEEPVLSTGSFLSLAFGLGPKFAVLAEALGQMSRDVGNSVATHRLTNQDQRFREWKIEDLEAVDRKSFVIMPRSVEAVSFRPIDRGWVAATIRRDNGHEWVVYPAAHADVQICQENLRRFGIRVTNTVEWDQHQERYLVIENDIDLV